jgi:uncharacterized repeat protein (TIGR01451 family)
MHSNTVESLTRVVGKFARGEPRRRRAVALLATLALSLGVLPGALMATATSAAATADPSGVSFTLQGCRNDGTIKLPINGKFVCPESAYTTGNLGKGWNELDLVPFQIVAKAGNSAPSAQTYAVAIALDALSSGHPGYDVLSSDGPGGAPVLNTSLSSSSCTALTSSPQQTKSPGVGGIDQSIYRTLTITQPANTTCVYDWYGRLALGSHLFPGSSLHADLLNQNLGTSGIGSKDVSIPVNQISPQELSKDMSASQTADNVWNITKSPTPAHLDFGNTCAAGGGPAHQPVSIKVSWQKEPSLGGITVITHVYATNPAARTITTNVTDVIYDAGSNVLDTKSSTTDVPANTTELVLTTTTAVPAGTAVPLSDTATGTYTDTVTGVPIPGSTTATASASPTVTTTNGTATITDTENITGTGLTFSADSTSGASGSFDNGYTPGTPTTGPVSWTSDVQSGDGSVTFNKTVYLDQPRQTTGSLDDTATVTGSDGFKASASGSVDITASAQVALTINKTIPDVLQGSENQTFGFKVQNGSNATVATPSVSFAAGDTSQSTTVSGLQPGNYTVSENTAAGWDPQPSQPVGITLPSCSGSVTFQNTVTPAHATAVKVTNPDGFTQGWDMTLTGPGTGPGGETVTTNNNGTAAFTTDLQEGSYTITEAPQAGWNQTNQSGDCSFTVDYPADGGKVFTCTITNTYQPDISLTKAGPRLDKVGDPANYTITLTNTSPPPGKAGAPTLDCTVTDPTINFSKTVTGLAEGQNDTSTPTYVIRAGDSDPFLNTAHATCTAEGSSPAITVSADSNTVSTNLFQPSVAISKTGPGNAQAGDTVTYTVTITNTSSSDSPNLVLANFSDSLVPGVTPPDACQNLAPGDQCSFSYTYTVQSGDPNPLVNTATVLYHPSGFPNNITDSATWKTNLLHPAFKATKSCTTEPVPQAGPAKFDVTFTNTGDADLVITADDGIGTFNLAAGATKTVTVTVNGPFAGQATVNNTVKATAALDPEYGLSDTIGPKTASASCDVMGLAQVIKTVSGQPPSGSQSFTFTLRQGADTMNLGTILETQVANAGNSGVLNFTTNLIPGNHYQMCEDVMPGWDTSLGTNLFVPGSMTTPTLPNPNVNNMTVCTDFVAQAGQTTTFKVDNTPPPGGRALTIGFWKNWASCTTSSTTKKPVLDQTLAAATAATTNPPGGLVVSAQNPGSSGWPNFAAQYYLVLKGSTSTPKVAPDCSSAVNLLNKTTIDGTTKKASNPLFNMAAQLVAAQLNYFAGAGKNGPTTVNIQSAVLLLGKYHFDGNTYSPALSSADTTKANCLATQLDNYNNDRSVNIC